MEELSEEEEVPQENLVAIPIPGLSLEILHTLQEIPPSPGPLLRLLVKDLTVGVGATVEEFEEAVSCEAEINVMVEALVESDEPLTNDPDTVGNFLKLGTW